jgi:hypothetical protein
MHPCRGCGKSKIDRDMTVSCSKAPLAPPDWACCGLDRLSRRRPVEVHWVDPAYCHYCRFREFAAALYLDLEVGVREESTGSEGKM